jgi:uncharacterized membrane protein
MDLARECVRHLEIHSAQEDFALEDVRQAQAGGLDLLCRFLCGAGTTRRIVHMFPDYLVFVVSALVLILVIGTPLVAVVLASIALRRASRTGNLTQRIEALEIALRNAVEMPRPTVAAPIGERPGVEAEQPEPVAAEIAGPSTIPSQDVAEAFNWERFVGQKTMGWVAVVLLVFATAFFLRYAYQNNWIGPVGRVAIGALAGAALVIAGHRYHRRGWRISAQMLSGGGMVVLYLATYSAFGFYHLLPQQHAGLFLALIVVESMVLAAVYNSPAVGLVAVLGGLLTPLLLRTEHDSYRSLFMYLAVLDVGVVMLMLLRGWSLIGSLALAGTHGIFWLWYEGNYHPEKIAWALGFQLAVYLIFLGHAFVAPIVRRWTESRESLARLVLTAGLWFTAFYVLTREDYHVWLGSAAVGMATVYAALARSMLTWRPTYTRLLLTSLAVAIGFIALAIPIQAEACWVALGWAVMGTALWWFGLRISAPPLRALAAGLGGLAVMRLLIYDIPHGTRPPFIPIFNEFGLPSVSVAVCLLLAVAVTKSWQETLRRAERTLVPAAGLIGILLLWLVLSIDCYEYFRSQGDWLGADRAQWRWMGQLALSVLWAMYAVVVLALGFRLRLARLRWVAIGLFAVTIAKVFFVDMSTLRQFYRILAFFILAVVLGLVARFYQRLSPAGPRPRGEGA